MVLDEMTCSLIETKRAGKAGPAQTAVAFRLRSQSDPQPAQKGPPLRPSALFKAPSWTSKGIGNLQIDFLIDQKGFIGTNAVGMAFQHMVEKIDQGQLRR